MNQERAINRILRDMKMAGLITTDESGDIRSGEARFYLNALWVAALEEGKRKNYAAFKKTVVLLSKEGKVLGKYESAEEAARQRKCGVRGIYNSIWRNADKHIGNYWKYEEDYLKNVS